MRTTKVLIGFYFYPRGGSAHACAAIARALAREGLDVRLVAGSRDDVEIGRASEFFSGIELEAVDFGPALRSGDPLRFEAGPGTAPMHASYEDRDGAEDRVFAVLDDEECERQVAAWQRALSRAGAAEADVLYLHHLTPMHEAAARVAPGVPIVTHVHGSELLMLERIAAGPPPHWRAAERWAERLRAWTASSARVVVNSPQGLERAAGLLGLERERFALVPNGVGESFVPARVDRAAHWRRHLVERPQGWLPGAEPGSVAYRPEDLAPLAGTVLLSASRLTEVKRLPTLIEAFAAARPRFEGPAALVILGGYPGEWEGEHPAETIRRIGARDVFLAGWHPHEELPAFFNAGDLLVHPSPNEQFGQVIVEAMACGLPAIAAARGGPAHILEDGRTGWLIPPDDPHALQDAIVEAVNDPGARSRLGENARRTVLDRYTWASIGSQLATLVGDAANLPLAELTERARLDSNQ